MGPDEETVEGEGERNVRRKTSTIITPTGQELEITEGTDEKGNFTITVDGQTMSLREFLDGIERNIPVVLNGQKMEIEELLDYIDSTGDEEEETFTFTPGLELPKRIRCTTRKRYIKLRMADGEKRNFAVWEADMLLRETKRCKSYQSAYLLNRASWMPVRAAKRKRRKKHGAKR